MTYWAQGCCNIRLDIIACMGDYSDNILGRGCTLWPQQMNRCSVSVIIVLWCDCYMMRCQRLYVQCAWTV